MAGETAGFDRAPDEPPDPRAGGSPRARAPGVLTHLPAAWTAGTVLFSLRAVASIGPLLFRGDLPGSIGLYLKVALAAELATIFWGILVLLLAWRGDRRFGRHFVAWQAAQIAWLAIAAAWVQLSPDFGSAPSALVVTAAQVAIGLFCLHLVRRRPVSGIGETAMPEDIGGHAAEPSVGRVIVAGALGLLVGGALGMGAGLLAGAGIAEATQTSCFEGACGFFAFFIGLGGLVLGAIAGGVLFARRAWRSRRPVPGDA